MHNIWTLEMINECMNGKTVTRACVNGRWVPARPLNYTCRSFKERIVESWMVFTGRAEAFVWPEGQ